MQTGKPMKQAKTSERRGWFCAGGVVGVTTAYDLAKHGFEVAVVEREAGFDLQISLANDSLTTPSMADPDGNLSITQTFAAYVIDFGARLFAR